MNQGDIGKYLTKIQFKNQDQEIEYVIWGDTRDFFAYRQNSTIQVDDNLYPNKIDLWKINNEIFFHPIESEKLSKNIIISIQNELSKLGISWKSHISQKML